MVGLYIFPTNYILKGRKTYLMQIDNKIVVLNYNEFKVIAPTSTRTYKLEPAQDGVPTLDNLPFSDIEYINSHSNAFRTGLLFFKKEQQEEIYKELKIFDWENILTNKDIENILLHPTIEGLQKIIDITDDVTFERVRGLLIKIKNSNEFDLSHRVIRLVEDRHKELQRRITKSQIEIRQRDATNPNTINSEEVDSLKSQLAEMQKMMAEMIANQNKGVNDTAEDDKEESTPVKKPAGRPSTKK